jgi:imidazolonepropionase
MDNLKEAKAAPEISAENMIIMPGFVDPGIRISVHPGGAQRKRRMQDFRSESAALLRACWQHGSLTVQIRACAGNGELRSDLAAMRQLAAVAAPASFALCNWALHPNLYVAPDTREALRFMAARHLAQGVELMPSAHDDDDAEVATVAARAKLPVDVKWSGGNPQTLVRILEQIQPRSVLCDPNIGPAEREVLGGAPQTVILAPTTKLLEEESSSCARELVQSGAALALSSGYDAYTNPTFSMQTVLSLAVLRMQLSCEEALTACTINAAHAVGRSHVTGSIESGKRADVLMMNIPDYRELPRRLGINNVAMAIRGGTVVFNRTGWKAAGAGAAA